MDADAGASYHRNPSPAPVVANRSFSYRTPSHKMTYPRSYCAAVLFAYSLVYMFCLAGRSVSQFQLRLMAGQKKNEIMC